LLRQRYGLARWPPGPQDGWVLWAAIDGGVRDPWCVHWFARSPDRGRVVVWKEWYETGVTPLRQAQRLKAQLASLGGRWLRWDDPVSGYPGRPPPTAVLHLDHIRVDPAMYISRANVGVSDAQIYAQAGLAPLLKGLNARVPGLRRVLEWLEEADD